MNIQSRVDPLFFAVEGLDGSGKTTLIDFLRIYLQSALNFHAARMNCDQFHVEKLSGWATDTDVGAAARNLVVTKGVNDPTVEVLLASAARRSLVNAYLDPDARVQKTAFIVDRYLYSTFAYQCVNDELLKLFMDIAFTSVKGVLPAMVFHLDLPPSMVTERVAGGRGETLDTIESRPLEFYEGIARRYDLAYKVFDFSRYGQKPPEIVRIDATLPIHEVQLAATQALDAYLNTLFGGSNLPPFAVQRTI